MKPGNPLVRTYVESGLYANKFLRQCMLIRNSLLFGTLEYAFESHFQLHLSLVCISEVCKTWTKDKGLEYLHASQWAEIISGGAFLPSFIFYHKRTFISSKNSRITISEYISPHCVLISRIQSLTKAIIFELFYYINGYFGVGLTSMNIHSKCHAYLLY